MAGREEIIDKHPSDVIVKAVGLYAPQFVVNIITHNVTGIMARLGLGRLRNDNRTYVLRGTGVIIECEGGVGENEGNYLCTILASASLFRRTNGVPPDQLQIDVYYGSGGKLFKGEVLACDFHYHLAAIRIVSDSPMPTATLRGLEDMSSIHLPEQRKLCMEKPFQLLPHSSLFKIMPGTKIIYLSRHHSPPYGIEVFSGVIGMRSPFWSDCKELLLIKDLNYYGNGGPVFNSFGEVIGISFKASCFLPSNFILRWWSHYKSCREFIRPWLGVEISNHHEDERFVIEFPNITGVVITKVKIKRLKKKRKRVEKNSSSYTYLQPHDVIVKCEGKVIHNKLELFDIIWDNVGKAVELSLLRPSNGRQWNESITVLKRTPDNLYQWPLPKATVLRTAILPQYGS